MSLIKENDVYKREQGELLTLKEKITFKLPTVVVYEKFDYDWFIVVALDKTDKVTYNRHLLTADLIIAYRNAIRQAYNYDIDSSLKEHYDHPRNRNTITGIQSYIERIKKTLDAQLNRKA